MGAVGLFISLVVGDIFCVDFMDVFATVVHVCILQNLYELNASSLVSCTQHTCTFAKRFVKCGMTVHPGILYLFISHNRLFLSRLVLPKCTINSEND